jgi:N-acetylmuramoyl-L-alanine amidase
MPGRNLILILLLFCPLGPQEERYIELKELLEKFKFTRIDDPISERIILQGDKSIVIATGSRSILLEGKIHKLSYPIKRKAGRILVPRELVRLLGPKKGDPPSAVGEFKVVIDPGHGGIFRGATGKRICEKDINLDISLRLKRMLRQSGFTVILTRQEDKNLAPNLSQDLSARVGICNRIQADLFISIHTNWDRKPSTRGFEIYIPKSYKKLFTLQNFLDHNIFDLDLKDALYYLLKERWIKDSRELAQIIRKLFTESLRIPDRGIKQANFHVLRGTQSPAVLVELDFLSNPQAEELLAKPSYREKLARLLAKAIKSYRNLR